MARKAVDKNIDTGVTENVAPVADETEKEDIKESKTPAVKKEIPLQDDDEVLVTAIISNVSYRDKINGDDYNWENVGDQIPVPYLVLKNDLWRNQKGYFKKMWLKPEDDRVIKQFGLSNLYVKYDKLLEPNVYTRDKVADTISEIKKLQVGLKPTVIDKIKNLVQSGEISDAYVIDKINKAFDLDLFSLV